jgi:hypothetical protein
MLNLTLMCSVWKVKFAYHLEMWFAIFTIFRPENNVQIAVIKIKAMISLKPGWLCAIPVCEVCIVKPQPRSRVLNFDAFYIFTIKFLKSLVWNFQYKQNEKPLEYQVHDFLTSNLIYVYLPDKINTIIGCWRISAERLYTSWQVEWFKATSVPQCSHQPFQTPLSRINGTKYQNSTASSST